LKTIKRSFKIQDAHHSIYNIVADIEQYPIFLPWCESAEIIQSHGDTVIAKLCLNIFGFRTSITTENQMQKSENIKMTLKSGPFRKFNASWFFEPQSVSTTQVTYVMNYQLINPIIERIIEKNIDSFLDQFMESFAKKYNQEITNQD
jgi:ribosome-associated toxin RatA of RatAB toxin-antitoxin module